MNVDRELRARLAEREAEAKTAAVEAEVQRRLDIMESFGEDIFDDGTVVRFVKTYAVGDEEMAYWFAAIKANDRWYVTSTLIQQRAGKTWDEFKEFLVSGAQLTEYVTVMLTGMTHPEADRDDL